MWAEKWFIYNISAKLKSPTGNGGNCWLQVSIAKLYWINLEN